jgi:Na+/H+ antiporter NhaD/arsenite permease-like protein
MLFHAILKFISAIFLIFFLYIPSVYAADNKLLNFDITDSFPAILALIVFVLAYILVMAEEYTHLRKSKPVIIAAGFIWAVVAYMAMKMGYDNHSASDAFKHTFLEFAELFIFLLVAMTFINSMTERNVFEALRSWLVGQGFTFRKIFWITGILAFFMSPIADNLTTALIMCAVVMAVGKNNTKFIGLACINIVVAANAGGAFSPFGDITTLMVWQKGIVSFSEFFYIFVPSVVNFIVPAAIMHFAVGNEKPEASKEKISVKYGGYTIIALFLGTIAFTVTQHQFLHLPPVFGMMTGLGVLSIYGYFLKKKEHSDNSNEKAFNIFNKVSKAEWDTLFFFYGVLMCVGGLSAFGYMSLTATYMYGDLGASTANILVGILSAIVDNIPVMFAVLTMLPEMDLGQWLLVTLTAGVGGSMLSIGSAAGVALMGQTKGIYTFFFHLKWTPIIILGYVASIIVHFLWNATLFNGIPL